MGMKTAPTITLGRWQTLHQAAQFIRTEVFVKEQGMQCLPVTEGNGGGSFHAHIVKLVQRVLRC